MSNYTPGPWTVQQLAANHHGYDWPTFAIRSPQNCCIAVVGEVDRYHAEQYEATARLIAAAPELFAIVQDEASLYAGMDADEFTPSTAARIKAMRSIIAKVTGEPTR